MTEIQTKLHEFHDLVLDLKQNRSNSITRAFEDFLSKEMVNPEPFDFLAFTVPEAYSYAILTTEVANNTFKLLSRLEREGHIEAVEMSTQTLSELIDQDIELDSDITSEIKRNDQKWVMICFSVINEDGLLSVIKNLSQKE
ncbi:MAG: hypothetical protein KGH99_05850 [Thaumarchaeota archaeon]|nr:hypothetical protein [Nitrososphaerota archaeon]